MLLCLLFWPSFRIKGHRFSTFYLPPLLGLLLLLCFGLLKPEDYFGGLIQGGAMNPLEILALFFSMAFISTVLDEVGFFAFLADKMVQKAKGSQFALFLSLYALCSILTTFTSNDIVILTFTPFLLCFAKEAKIDPIPYLVCEFVAANTWSMLFIFGNPTNVYLASKFGLDFISYLSKMALPTVFASLASLSFMLLLFQKKLKGKIEVEQEKTRLGDPFLLISSLVILLGATVLMALSGFLNLPMWIFASIGAGLLLILALFRSLSLKTKPVLLLSSLKRLPFTLAPFLLSMFGIVMAFSSVGLSLDFGNWLNQFSPVWGYGLASFLSANVMNNLPMSVLFGDVLSLSNAPSQALFACIASSNLGAILTPLGALAGILWMGILKDHGVSFSFGKFCLYGVAISLPSLLASLAALMIG